MKKILFTVLALGTSVSAMANNPYDVCESIRNNTSSTDRITKCMSIVSRNQIDRNAIPILVKLAKSSTTETLNSLKAVSNKSLQIEAVQTCNSILNNTSSYQRVTSCLSKAGNKSFEPSVLKLISSLAKSSTTEALNSIGQAANKSFQLEAVQTCSSILSNTSSYQRVTSCIGKIANNDFDPSALIIINNLAKSSTTEALNSVNAVANSYFQIEGVKVCSAILRNTSSYQRVTSCLGSIANKSFAYGSTVMCERTASSSTTEALNCLRTIARDYTPRPTPGPTRPDPIPTDSEEIIVNLADITKRKR